MTLYPLDFGFLTNNNPLVIHLLYLAQNYLYYSDYTYILLR